jgi:prepilin-type N-terminal cleavage/methylation domain-containing protein
MYKFFKKEKGHVQQHFSGKKKEGVYPAPFFHKKNGAGFTLVELLVAIGLFAVVLTISLGSVISILDAGRKARSLQSVLTNLNFTLETMTREIKFGYHYHCILPSEVVTFPLTSQNCSGNPNGAQPAIAFVASDGTGIIYKLNGTQIVKSVNGGLPVGVTAPEVQINSLKYYVFNSFPQTYCPGINCDNAQPRVIIVVSGQAGAKASTQTSFTIQTTVSQRLLDLGP